MTAKNNQISQKIRISKTTDLENIYAHNPSLEATSRCRLQYAKKHYCKPVPVAGRRLSLTNFTPFTGQTEFYEETDSYYCHSVACASARLTEYYRNACDARQQ
jgi:hypothetical protein